MKGQRLHIVLAFLLSPSCLWGQQSQIAYFTSDSSSYLVPDLYASLNDSIYTLIDSRTEECHSMEVVKDYNKDGQLDILVGNIKACGGNCCGNSYFFFSYNNGRFSQTKAVGNGNYLHSEQWKGNWAIVVHSNTQDSTTGHRRWIKERYMLEGDSIVKIGTYLPSKINASEGDYLLFWKDSVFQNDDRYFIHTVKKEGQSLWALANKYKTSVEAIKKLNQRQHNVIHLGEQLKIPQKNKALFHLHHVKEAGESLWGISQKYQVPIDIIKRANGLENDRIQLGSFLKIPKLEGAD